MPYRRSDDLWAPLALLSLGLAVPGLLWVIAGDVIALYVSPVELTIGWTVAYGLLAWFLIDRGAVDRTSHLLVSLIWPWPLLFGVLFAVLLLNRGEQVPRGPLAGVFRAITADWPGSLIGYGAMYAAVGVAVFVVSRRYDAWRRSVARLPTASRLLAAVAALVVLVAVVTTGANAVTSQAASIERLGPGTVDYHDPTFNVTVVGPADELRVTVTTPGGHRVTRRLSRGAMRGGSGTVPFPLDFDDDPTRGALPVQDGTYRVRVASLAGLPVATATFHAAPATGGSLAVVPMTDDPPWSADPFVYRERNASDTSLGFTITNEGAFQVEMALVVRVPDDPIVFDDLPMAPGDEHGVVVRLAPESINAIRAEAGGSVTVELYASAHRSDPVSTATVPLPPAG